MGWHPSRWPWLRHGVPVLACLLSVFAGWLLAVRTHGSESDPGLTEAVIAAIQSHSVNPPDGDSLRSVAVAAVLEATGDPYTRLLDPSDYRVFQRDTEGVYVGVGLEVEVRGDTLTVVSTVPGSPAANAGVRAGDRILAVDGQSTGGWNRSEAERRLQGEKGTATSIDVVRPDTGVDRLTLRRNVIHTNPVRSAFMLDATTGFVELTGFPANAAERVREAVETLASEGMEHLIIDLRDNPGGLLQSAFDIVAIFVPERTLIATLQGPGLFGEADYHTDTPPHFPDLPLTLLTGPRTASSAEIVAAALRDHDRATLVGAPTYGKGAVQSLVPIGHQRLLKLTTGLWVSPDGQALDHAISGRQLAPDWTVQEVRDPGEEMLFLSLGEQWGTFRAVVRQLAYDVADHRMRSIDGALAALPERLRREGIALPDPVLEAARLWIRSRLDYDLARYQGHSDRARAALLRADPVVQEALVRARGGGH